MVPSTEIGDLYRALSATLQRIVRCDVRASDPVIEDACQFAWSRLVHHAGRVRRETVLAWLARTATREACRLTDRDHRELSLEREIEMVAGALPSCDAPGPEELAFCRERLRWIGGLPERQQLLVWLHALGLSYAEIALHTGCTERTVERQLLRAKRSLRMRAAA